MTNVEKEVKRLEKEFGKDGNISFVREAFHACDPARPNGWDCDAVRQISEGLFRTGRVQWDFEEELEDASDYDFSNGVFVTETLHDMSYSEDREELFAWLSQW